MNTGLQDTLKFNGIDVIESIPTGEAQTGTDLFESVIQPHAFPAEPTIHCRLHVIQHPGELLGVLSDIERRTKIDGIYPVVHIEAHGSKQGLRLSDGSRLGWLDLLDALTSINVACRLNLLVVMSACWGADVVRVVHPAHRAPFWGTVGPSRSVSASTLLASYSVFYRTYLTTFDGRAAIMAMRSAQEPESRAMALRSSEVYFRLIFFRYIREHSSGKLMQERIDRILSWIFEDDPTAVGRADEIREWARATILDHKTHFERYKREFFMFDLYPELEDRFSLTYEDGPPWDIHTLGDATSRSDGA